MTEERFALWWAGKIEDEELSDAEARWLEEAVFTALQRKYQTTIESTTLQ